MQVPALLRAKVIADDQLTIEKSVTVQTGYMVLREFEHNSSYTSTHVFPTKSTAIAYANGAQIIEVDIVRK